MFRKKNKGFTLIELLVTILILSITSVVGFVAVKSIIDKSSEDSNEVNIKNIIASSKNYTDEFKTEEKYWAVTEDKKEEYACTTIGMLINKGYLKDSILNTVIDDNAITRDTSILIKRDINTKVNTYVDISDINNDYCVENATIKANFTVYGEKGKNNWYINDVDVKVELENSNQVDNISYYIKENDNKIGNDKLINVEENLTIKVGNEGRNLDFCINVTTLRDKTITFCLSDENDTYNMDKSKPESPNLDLNKKNDNYYIVSNNASDNLTSEDKLKYFIIYDEEKEEKEHILDGNISSDIIDKKVKTYVEDEAGNKSDIVVKKLNITSSQDSDTTSKTEYYCSLDNDIYSSDSDASDNCSKLTIGTVSSSKYYTCSYNSTEYTSYDSAFNDCIKTVYGTITSTPHTNTSSTTVSGSCTYNLICSNGTVYESSHTCTNYGCPSGYNKVSWSCGSPGTGGSCSGSGSVGTHTASCSNKCSKTTTTYTYYCSLGYSVNNSYSNCSETTRGTVSEKTRYYCDLNNSIYENESTASESCEKTETGTVSNKVKYTCPLNNKDYDTNELATSACTNYCSLGDYYNNWCYSLS